LSLLIANFTRLFYSVVRGFFSAATLAPNRVKESVYLLLEIFVFCESEIVEAYFPIELLPKNKPLKLACIGLSGKMFGAQHVVCA
jgi:hypothetical protein